MTHCYFKRVLKTLSIRIMSQTSVKKMLGFYSHCWKNKTIQTKKSPQNQGRDSCFLQTTSKPGAITAIISCITLCAIQDRGNSVKFLFRTSACKWIRHSECCSCVWFLFNSFGWYHLALISLSHFILSHLAFSSVVLNFTVQYNWSYSDAENIALTS